MPVAGRLHALPVGVATAVSAAAFGPALAPQPWVIRQKGPRRAHLLLLQEGRGSAAWQGTRVTLEGPTLLWLPGSVDAAIEASAGARGYLVSADDDFLIRIIATSPEALNLQRATERVVLIANEPLLQNLQPITESCGEIAAELRNPAAGATTLISSHLLLLCLSLWRLGAPEEEREGAPHGGPALVGNLLQLIELHYRDGWTVARYAAALGVSSDRLHAHCRREKGCGPRSLIRERLLREACLRLEQLDLPVEQIGYGLGFRDAAYFNRFFRKSRGISPGSFRRQIRLEHARRQPSYAAWP
ncbi:MAG: helix-turn-helix domain-containing protein [Bradyrhizobium sp.]|uniref:helix-turn-helix domain-containing protein n=1 Tax=Bradyrhizobium sp. TaxID=376 RepID=UPI0025BBD041|nr:helix-turn-helix domain-containing protein [Bradyrhizobium sp.]MBI5261991.1 helix-turn-helix domain-containing protein [Bradyrhizobium sp.]